MTVRILSGLVLVALVPCAFGGIAAAAPIGEAASVVPASSYTRGAAERTLSTNEKLEQNDRIRTSGNGSTRIRFLDDTMLTIGPDSEVVLDRFVFDGNRAQTATVEVVRGAMRFVSGTSDRRAYEIKTPVATIGVRGTVVDIGFQNGRWSFNTVDGSITATLLATGETRTFQAGSAGFSIGPGGFIPLNLNDASQLWRRLDGAHLALAKVAGQSPSAPQGAAAGPQQGQQQGGNQGGSQGSKEGSGGPGSGQSGGPAFSSPPTVTDLIASSVVVLGPTGPGPTFALPAFGSPLQIVGTGGNIPISPAAESTGRLFMDNSPLTAAWDAGNNGAFRGGQLSGTNPTTDDPGPIALARMSAKAVEVTTGLESGQALYQIGRWTNGVVAFSQQLNNTFGEVNLNPNQGLHYIIFGYTGGLYELSGSSQIFEFGKTYSYSLEAATKPTWSDGQGAPGTLSNTSKVYVNFGTTSVHYGMEGSLNMGGGNTIDFQTGAITPTVEFTKSGASNSTLGGSKLAFASMGPDNIGGSLCTTSDCFGEVEFVNVAKGKIGVVYTVVIGDDFETDPQINGAAIFGNPSATILNYTQPVIATSDPYSAHISLSAYQTDGIAEISGSNILLRQVNDGGPLRIRTANTVSADLGSVPGLLAWERWTVEFDSNSTVTSIPTNGGVHFIHGQLATNIPTGATGGLSVQYSLVGGTSPTVADGTEAPGLLGSGSKMAVDFLNLKIGLELFISIGAANYQMKTTDGVATPGNSEISFGTNGIFNSGHNIPVTLVSGSDLPSCTTSLSNCKGTAAGFLAGDGASHAGLAYFLYNTTGTLIPIISGVAAFGRDFPASDIGGYGFAGFSDEVGNPFFGGTEVARLTPPDPINPLSSGVPVTLDTPTGLALNSFNLDTSSAVNGWHRTGASPAEVKEQGRVAGVLGWERWTNGNVHSHKGSGNVDYTLNSNQGVHLIHGVRATNIPVNTVYTYALTGGGGATNPTVADGSIAPGTLTNATVKIDFSATAPKFGIDMNVGIDGHNFNVNSTPGAAPTLPANSIQAGFFSANALNVSKTTVGVSSLCSGSCTNLTGLVNGMLTGDGAKSLGIIYQFGNASNPTKYVTGAGGLVKQ
jgi:hypothetical protein